MSTLVQSSLSLAEGLARARERRQRQLEAVAGELSELAAAGAAVPAELSPEALLALEGAGLGWDFERGSVIEVAA